MLEELSIRNFAIIDRLTLSFSSGLTVLTGETGAGKSIIIDALGLLAGGRSSVDFVRHGTKKAEIEGLFRIHSEHEVVEVLEEAGIDIEDDMIILKREINEKGKSVCRINGELVTLTMQRAIGQQLVDIHGQHEHQDLLQPDKHSAMVDGFLGDPLFENKQQYEEKYRQVIGLEEQLSHLKDNDRENVQRLDLIEYQLEEIKEAKLKQQEDEELTAEQYKLANMEKLFSQMQLAYEALYGDEKGLELVREAMVALQESASIDQSLEEINDSLTNNFYMLEEVTFQIRDHVEQLDYDPNRLDFISKRLDEINHLKRKYGSTIEEVLLYAERITEEAEELSNLDEKIESVEKDLHTHKAQALSLAQSLSKSRKHAAKQLKAAIEMELKDLFMEKTSFTVQFHPHRRGIVVENGEEVFTLNEDGLERMEFYLSSNPGEPEKSLSKVASGGEISRIMLALKSILTDRSERTALIFDEVDTGVSGRVAGAIGEKIYAISNESQVLCITHLPQVASLANTHMYIKKREINNRVSTEVEELNDDQRIDELARMLSGSEITTNTKETAREMLWSKKA
ncbi:DNA repair protein RecN [Geomicrobium sp. JCM 19037]|uniref:DNA repair protein RecN n=1 Tax=unclassified Geomicrobium TaxID=2628951 RepID=UPI00045F48C8|nr:DNA repair protein RecN [Geomicrobium sp. JCM 19037]GAK03322.1 DNA repair protein RecN [Geomicrobium sp. JCM 19037]